MPNNATGSPVTIVGGGFAAFAAIKYLLNKEISVNLISDQNYFLFTPLLPEIASGSIPPKIAQFHWNQIKNKQFNFVEDYIKEFDFENKTLKGKNGDHYYTTLLITTGVVNNYFSIQGIQHAFTLKKLDDAIRLKKALDSLSEKDGQKITIIGAGATGTELAGEISVDLNKTKKCLTIINGAPKILDQFTRSMSERATKLLQERGVKIKNNCSAKNITNQIIETQTGENIESDLTILVAGNKANTVTTQIPTLDSQGYIKVNAYLQSTIYPDVFAAGDIMSSELKYPKLAQVATKAGKLAGKNIYHHLNQKPLKKFDYQLRGNLVSLGPLKAVGEIKKINIWGWWVWLLWRLVHATALPHRKSRLWLWINTIGKLF